MNGVLLAVTGFSLLVGVVSLVVAWRVVREDRRRSEARVSALSDAIYEHATERPTGAPEFFEAAPSGSPSRFGLIAAGACAVAVVVALTLVTVPSVKQDRALNPSRAAVSNAPLELLALEHQLDGSQLLVRGLVRNPASGTEKDGLTAVVLAYDRAGNLLASARAAVSVTQLGAGMTMPFVVRIPAADVSRFRVSFRTGTRIEPHVDRRARADAIKDVDP
jgi:hypothetical protein